jgi:hypothetical protein
MYRKIRFTSKRGETAAIIVPESHVSGPSRKSISDISRLFPVSEAMKMGVFEWSPSYVTFEDALDAEWKLEGRTRVNML